MCHPLRLGSSFRRTWRSLVLPTCWRDRLSLNWNFTPLGAHPGGILLIVSNPRDCSWVQECVSLVYVSQIRLPSLQDRDLICLYICSYIHLVKFFPSVKLLGLSCDSKCASIDRAVGRWTVGMISSELSRQMCERHWRNPPTSPRTPPRFFLSEWATTPPPATFLLGPFVIKTHTSYVTNWFCIVRRLPQHRARSGRNISCLISITLAVFFSLFFF